MDSFADIFFSFLLLPEATGWNGKDWRLKRKNEWLASGWIMRKEIGVRMVKKIKQKERQKKGESKIKTKKKNKEKK